MVILHINIECLKFTVNSEYNDSNLIMLLIVAESSHMINWVPEDGIVADPIATPVYMG